MTTVRSALVGLLIFALGCDRNQVEDATDPSMATRQRIRVAEEDLFLSRKEFEAFPRLDVIVRATRGFVIIRQVEMSDKQMDLKTQEDLRNARHRSAAVLAQLAVFEPQLRNMEKSLMKLRGSLFYLARQNDLAIESRSSIMRFRSHIGKVIDDLDLVIRVLREPETVYPSASEYYDPDFTGWICDLEKTLSDLRMKIAQ